MQRPKKFLGRETIQHKHFFYMFAGKVTTQHPLRSSGFVIPMYII